MSLTDDSGGGRQSIFYDAWGDERDRSGLSANAFRFGGHEKDDATGLVYAKARFYDPSAARLLTQDPVVGKPTLPPSLHRYLYAFSNPLRFIDPTGLTTEEQFAHLIAVATERYLGSGNLTALGQAGETILERSLSRAGYAIVKGPATLPGQYNADVIAFDPEAKRFTFFDNKIQTAKETVSKSDALTKTRARSIDVARENIEQLVLKKKIPTSLYDEMLEELGRLELDHTRAAWVVTTEAPEQVTNLARRISVRLARKGVRMAQVTEEGLKIKGLEESLDAVKGTKKFLTELGRAAPVAGLAVSAVIGSKRVEAASRDDLEYATAMAVLDAEPRFANYSVERELAVIAGEETTSEALAWGGGAVGMLCGPWCAAGGAVVGGVGGDYLGGYLAGQAFDREHGVTDEEMREIVRELK